MRPRSDSNMLTALSLEEPRKPRKSVYATVTLLQRPAVNTESDVDTLDITPAGGHEADALGWALLQPDAAGKPWERSPSLGHVQPLSHGRTEDGDGDEAGLAPTPAKTMEGMLDQEDEVAPPLPERTAASMRLVEPTSPRDASGPLAKVPASRSGYATIAEVQPSPNEPTKPSRGYATIAEIRSALPLLSPPTAGALAAYETPAALLANLDRGEMVPAPAPQTVCKHPVLVHCSDGAERTGLVLAVDICLRQLEQAHRCDPLQVVAQVRQDRPGSLLHVAHYRLLHTSCIMYAAKLQPERCLVSEAAVVPTPGETLALPGGGPPLSDEPWYHGPMSREEAEKTLTQYCRQCANKVRPPLPPAGCPVLFLGAGATGFALLCVAAGIGQGRLSGPAAPWRGNSVGHLRGGGGQRRAGHREPQPHRRGERLLPAR